MTEGLDDGFEGVEPLPPGSSVSVKTCGGVYTAMP